MLHICFFKIFCRFYFFGRGGERWGVTALQLSKKICTKTICILYLWFILIFNKSREAYSFRNKFRFLLWFYTSKAVFYRLFGFWFKQGLLQSKVHNTHIRVGKKSTSDFKNNIDWGLLHFLIRFLSSKFINLSLKNIFVLK